MPLPPLTSISRYALDVNPDRVEDLLAHQRLLEVAKTLAEGAVAVGVRPIQVCVRVGGGALQHAAGRPFKGQGPRGP